MMRLLSNNESRRVWFGRSNRPYSFTFPVDEGEFALLLVIADDEISPDEQADVSERLVRSGCRYAVCFGPTSSSWDDSIDMVGVMDAVDGRPSPFVMTTWHDDESIRNAVDFFADNTRFDEWSPRQFVVFILGGSNEIENEILKAVRERFE